MTTFLAGAGFELLLGLIACFLMYFLKPLESKPVAYRILSIAIIPFAFFGLAGFLAIFGLLHIYSNRILNP